MPVAERTQSGALRTSSVQAIRSLMLKRGMALIPSDCGYVLAALAADEASAQLLGKLTGQPAGACELSFQSIFALSERSTQSDKPGEAWFGLSLPTISILERFTPGPVTVICERTHNLPDGFASGFDNGGVALRVPDSLPEGQIAGSTIYPLATRALLNAGSPGSAPITDFSHALAIVSEAAARYGTLGWIAVEGAQSQRFSQKTVVDARHREPLLLQEGDIPFSEMKAAAADLPGEAFEDWG